MKLFIREVEDCRMCPNITWDINITRWLCKKTNKMLHWMNGEDDTIDIPDNCPLNEITGPELNRRAVILALLKDKK